MKLIPKVIAGMVLASAATAALAQDITLTYMSWDPKQVEVEWPTIADFEKAHPGVKVKIIEVPADQGYWPKLTSMAAGSSLPDVFMMSSGFVKEWGEAGNLLDLTGLVTDEQLSEYYESAANIGLVNGKRVAFPQNWVAPVMFYNIDMFEAANVPLPTADWTWDEFLSAAKSLTIDKNGDGKPDQWGMSLYGRYAHIEPWVFRNGGRYLNEDETALDLNDEAVNALRFLTDLVVKEKVAPMPQEMEGIRQQDIFPLGMAAMWVDGSWNIANTRDNADASMNWGIVQVPVGPDATTDSAVAYAWADMLSVGATSKHPDLAWEFVQHMVGGGRSASDFLGGKIPAYVSIAQSKDWLEKDQRPANKELLLQIGEQPVYTGFSRNWGAWRGYAADGAGGMNGELDEVFNGRQSLEEAIEKFTAHGNDVLSK
ncbi:ABC transporter substrate-binding protein [Maritalea sp.]|uniref:ABC transporter substrate-binding protein n=1 Tax=Maritalea sp. TaxID=2003361 RepID=UPI003EF95913